MNLRESKKLLKESLELESELYDFCVECLKRLYGDNYLEAVALFNDGYDFYEYNGCIQSLQYIDSKMTKMLKERDEMKTVRDNLNVKLGTD